MQVYVCISNALSNFSHTHSSASSSHGSMRRSISRGLSTSSTGGSYLGICLPMDIEAMFEVSHSHSLPPLHLSNLFLYSVPVHVCVYLHVHVYIPQNGMDYVNVHVNVHCTMVGCIGYIISCICTCSVFNYNNYIMARNTVRAPAAQAGGHRFNSQRWLPWVSFFFP